MSDEVFIFDCDPGIDDAIALFTFAGLLKKFKNRKDFFVVATWGNVELEKTFKNAKICAGILGELGFDVKVAKGESDPLEGERYEAKKIHGEDGLGGAVKRWSKYEKSAKVVEIEDIIKLCNGKDTYLLATGPLSSVAKYIEKVGPKKVVWMGGAFFVKGNTTEWAEFNALCDPKALEKVVTWCIENKVSFTAVPLDATEKTMTKTQKFFEILDETQAKQIVKRFVKSILQNTKVFTFHDPLASTLFFDESICDIGEGKFHIDVKNFRGMTRASLFPGNFTRVALDTDTQKFFETLKLAFDELS